jgi:tetratricopeptide (TPR) repeat protein
LACPTVTCSPDDEVTRPDLEDDPDPAALDDAIPTRLGRYVILERLGEGGMGVVLAAWDEELDRAVAIKLLRRRNRVLNAGPRLVREAQALARLSHPNVVAVYDASCGNGHAFVAMELVRGCTLREWIGSAPRSVAEILAMFDGAAMGLAAAHEAGIVHRDFKPDNVLVGDDGRPRVADFGLALGSSDDLPRVDASTTSSSSALDVALTASGIVVGTPAYMAPEQRGGEAATTLSDQYSFCVALWEALFGARPGSDRLADVVPPAGVRVPTWLRRALVRGLSPRPANRWPSMHALRAALREPRRLARELGAAAIVVAGFGAWAGARGIETAPCGAEASTTHAQWSAADRERVREAMLATGVGHAESAWTAVAVGLDATAAELVDARRAVCTADDAEAVAACLDHRDAALGAVVDMLASADAQTIDRARAIVGGLPSVAVCSDPQARARELPMPTDVDAGIEAQAIRGLLSSATAAREARRFDVGTQTARDALERADRLGFDPVRAEALLTYGSLLELMGADAKAEPLLVDAVMVARATGDDRVAALAMMRLVGVVGYRLARVDEGRQWGRHAQSMVVRADLELADRAELTSNIAAVEFRAGGYAQAEAMYREVTASVAGPTTQREHAVVAHARNNLGNVLAMQGRYREAAVELRRSTEVLTAMLGEDHPTVAMAYINLGNVTYDLGDLAQAAAHQRRAHEIASASVGPSNPLVAASLANLGVITHRLGRSREAKRMLEEAVALREAVTGPHHPDLAYALNNLGEVDRELGLFEEALASHERAAAIWSAADPNHPTAIYAKTNRGLDLLGLGRTSEALTALRAAMAECEWSEGDPPRIAATKFGLAQALVAADPLAHADEAEALAKAARDQYEALGGRYLFEIGKIDVWLDAQRDA